MHLPKTASAATSRNLWRSCSGRFDPRPPPPGGHTPETIRAKMLKLIAEARAAQATPWPLRQTRSHMVMFSYMAEWLPKDEGEQLLMEFVVEMRRLGHEEPPSLSDC